MPSPPSDWSPVFFLVIVNVLYVLGFAKVATLFLVIVNVLRVPGFEGKVV